MTKWGLAEEKKSVNIIRCTYEGNNDYTNAEKSFDGIQQPFRIKMAHNWFRAFGRYSRLANPNPLPISFGLDFFRDWGWIS